MSRWRVVAAIGTLVTLALSALVLAGSIPSNVDDGFIVLVYARHFAETGRIFWNASDGAVDGFTSFLDMMVKAASARIAPGDLVRNAHVIALVTYFGSVAVGAGVAYAACARRDPPTATGATGATREMIFASVAALVFAFHFALAQATSFLLEGPMFTLLTLASAAVLLLADTTKRRVQVALVALWVLLGLARPEGVPLAVGEAAWLAFVIARGRATKERFAPGAAFLAIMAVYALWHRSYFGAWAPNTFYAKSSDSRLNEIADGAAYVRAYASAGVVNAVLVVAMFASPLLALRRSLWCSNDARLRFAGVALLGAVAGLEVVVEGGDSYEGGRFLAAPIALVLLAIALAVAGLEGRARHGAVAVAGLVVLSGLARGTSHPDERLRRVKSWPIHEADYACEIEVAAAVAARVSVVAQTDFQRLKFYRDDLKVIDLMGLNDRALAHSASPGRNRWGKGGPAAAPASHADVLEIGIVAIQPAQMSRFGVPQIVRTDRLATAFIGYPVPDEARAALAADYTTASLPICGLYFNFFVRKDVAPRFTDIATVH